MPRKSNNDLSLLKKMVDKHSQDVIDEFLSRYGYLSRRTMKVPYIIC